MKTKASNKLIFIIVLLLVVLVSSLSAYFIAKDTIVNTFVVGDLISNVKTNFVLKEHKVVDLNNDGIYELSNEEVRGNEYVIFPSVDIPKDPFVKITELYSEAYLYVEVVGENNADFSWSVNNNWVQTDLEGTKGGVVYAYKGSGENVRPVGVDEGADFLVYILDGIKNSGNGGIKISSGFNAAEVALEFYGYLIEAKSFENYIEAFNYGF